MAETHDHVIIIQNRGGIIAPIFFYFFHFFSKKCCHTACKYFLKNGNGHEKHLYFDSIERHISEMLKLQDEIRPEWLTRSDIIDYGRKMIYYRDIKKLFAADKYCFGYLG